LDYRLDKFYGLPSVNMITSERHSHCTAHNECFRWVWR